MFPTDHAGIRSQLEWNSRLSTDNAPLLTEQNKYLRKVGYLSLTLSFNVNTILDVHYSNNRYP